MESAPNAAFEHGATTAENRTSSKLSKYRRDPQPSVAADETKRLHCRGDPRTRRRVESAGGAAPAGDPPPRGPDGARRGRDRGGLRRDPPRDQPAPDGPAHPRPAARAARGGAAALPPPPPGARRLACPARRSRSPGDAGTTRHRCAPAAALRLTRAVSSRDEYVAAARHEHEPIRSGWNPRPR